MKYRFLDIMIGVDLESLFKSVLEVFQALIRAWVLEEYIGRD